jgi:biotin carboxyl carrier protein
VRFRVVVDGDAHEIEAERGPRGLTVRVDGAEYRPRTSSLLEDFVVRIGARTYRIRFEGRDVLVDAERHELAIPAIEAVGGAPSREERSGAAEALDVRPPMPGRIVRILAPAGTRVARGQVLLVLEAMKMQNEIVAPRDGIIQEVRVAEGDVITADRVVAVLEVR